MSQLLVIFNIDAEDEVCRLFLPYWRRSGCDLLMFSSPIDAPSKIEGVRHVNFGRKLDGLAEHYWWYQSRVYQTFQHCLTLPFDAYVFTQYDSVFLGLLPDIKRTDSIHTFACGPTGQFEARLGLHPPWIFGRDRLKEFIEAAAKESIELEGGVMDRWIACIMQRHSLNCEPCTFSFSANKLDTPELIASARQSIKCGALFVHGVGDAKTLAAILE